MVTTRIGLAQVDIDLVATTSSAPPIHLIGHQGLLSVVVLVHERWSRES